MLWHDLLLDNWVEKHPIAVDMNQHSTALTLNHLLPLDDMYTVSRFEL